MTELQRVIKVIEWLIYIGYAENRRDLSKILGYTESSLSQILNGKVKLSKAFIKKLSISDGRINYDWLMTGEGEMLRSEKSISQTVKGDGNTTSASIENKEEENKALLEALKSQQALLSKSQEHIDRLISIIEKSK